MYAPEQIIQEIVKRTPINQFTKTLRGVKFKDVEFIFATDKVVEDPCIVAKRKGTKHEHFIRSKSIRERLISIFESI